MGYADFLIKAENLGKEYACPEGGSVKAVEDLSFSVREGEILSIVGPSGCGKSTTISIIAGFEKPTLGRIEFMGKQVEG
ncbi:MAG: ATP-binding cassette domain-containing protein, partial [Candidatus Altiarchaeota archaeon]|nr:ATP-binding cassette domain-containing protein [Candidatus Altiarchaeota archaeon]